MNEISTSMVGAALRLDPRWFTPCMAKLEKLDWIDAFVVTGWGVKVGVRVSDPQLIPLLDTRLAPGTKIARGGGKVDRVLSVILGGAGARPGVKRYHMLYADHVLAGKSHTLEHMLENYDSHLRLALAQFSKKKLFIHGGSVAIDGKAIVFPGNTLAGKSTLVAELIRAGAEYLSDEYAIVDAGGMVHPFAKPVSLRETRTARQKHVRAEELGARTARKPVPLGAVVLTEYEEGASWSPQPLAVGHAVIEMMQYTIGIRMDPKAALDILGPTAQRAPILRGKRPDTVKAVPRLFQLAERHWGAASAAGSA